MKKITIVLVIVLVLLCLYLFRGYVFSMDRYNELNENNNPVLKYYHLKNGDNNIIVDGKKLNFSYGHNMDERYLNGKKVEYFTDCIIVAKDYFISVIYGQFGANYEFYDFNGNKLHVNLDNAVGITGLYDCGGMYIREDGIIEMKVIEHKYIEGTSSDYESTEYYTTVEHVGNEIVVKVA